MTESTSMTTLADQVERLRSDLLRFARLQLRNDVWAEDVVSETLLAALEKPASFSGRSQVKTWLIGILKHKIIDCLRTHAREVATANSDDERTDLDDLMFDEMGMYREIPRDWGNPESSLSQQQFFAVLEACVEHLPNNLGRVFLMREWLELDTKEICRELGIGASNVWVMLHRARMRLRECLELNWFASKAR